MQAWGAADTWVQGDGSREDFGCYIIRKIDGRNERFDACLLWELEELWKHGIETECHCCGHGMSTPGIGVSDEESIRRMRAMGYEETPRKPDCAACECWVRAWFRPKSQLYCKKGAEYNV